MLVLGGELGAINITAGAMRASKGNVSWPIWERLYDGAAIPAFAVDRIRQSNYTVTGECRVRI